MFITNIKSSYIVAFKRQFRYFIIKSFPFNKIIKTSLLPLYGKLNIRITNLIYHLLLQAQGY